MKTTLLNGVYLRTRIKSCLRPRVTSQRRWVGFLLHSLLLHFISGRTTSQPHPPHPESMGLGSMNGALWCVSVTAANVFTSIWSVGEAANWVSVFPGHQEVSLSINTESRQRLLQMLFPTRFQVGSNPLQALDVIYCVRKHGPKVFLLSPLHSKDYFLSISKELQ